MASAMNLNNAALATLPIEAPNYDRGSVSVGIAHIGAGHFHRAHQAMYIDRLLELGLARDWGICGVGVMPGDWTMRDVLRDQDGLYTLVLEKSDRTRDAHVIGSIIDYRYAPDGPAFALITEALDRRRRRGIAGPTIVSCDNIESNGEVAARAVLAHAESRDPGLAEWVAENT